MLEDGRESDNIEDRRGMGGGRTMAFGGGGLGLIALLIYVFLCGGNPQNFINQFGGQQTQVQQPQQPGQTSPQNDAQKKFASFVLATTEDAWKDMLPKQAGIRYTNPTLVLFSGQTQSACGAASASTGPFYCPGDQKLYLDMAFFAELRDKFKAPGDFADAYVIAHEIGHHVQNLVGTMNKVNGYQQQVNEAQSNQLSVRLELQADCYAGVWGNWVQKQGKIQVGDVDAALRAAASVGDDSIQKRTQGYVVPESFTLGSEKARSSWFAKGFQTGDIRQCNTFSGIRGF